MLRDHDWYAGVGGGGHGQRVLILVSHHQDRDGDWAATFNNTIELCLVTSCHRVRTSNKDSLWRVLNKILWHVQFQYLNLHVMITSRTSELFSNFKSWIFTMQKRRKVSSWVLAGWSVNFEVFKTPDLVCMVSTSVSFSSIFSRFPFNNLFQTMLASG